MNTHRKPRAARIAAPLPPAVRRWLYGTAAAVAPLAVVYGYVTDQQAVLWLNLAGAVLFVMAVGNTPARPDERPAGDEQ